MRNYWQLLAGTLAGALVLPLAVEAGPGPPPCVPPPGLLSSLLFVRFIGAPTLRATFVQADGQERTAEPPSAAGLRPGYFYHVQLSGLPERLDRPDAPTMLFPTLEVRGSLALAPGRSTANFPVPIVLSNEDIAKAQDGVLITKVFYLENPEESAGASVIPGQPFELDVGPGGDPWAEARAHGRLVLVLRLGERQASREELAAEFIPGTVLLPGDKALPPAARPPVRPWDCWRVYDPILGPKPHTEECLRDGGDAGLRAGIGADGRLYGVEPADTVAEYTDSIGHRHVTPSNCVCIYAPRFAVARIDVAPASYGAVSGPNARQTVEAQALAQARLVSRTALQAEQVEVERGREKASGIHGSEGVVITAQFEGTATVSGKLKTAAIAGECPKPGPGPDRPLILCKEADRYTARVGDVITFTLKYSNSGAQPMTDVVVTDSLTGRLEYVPGSAKADRDAVFTTKENEAGSLVLRWQINGQLLPAQGGRITFQARVR